MNGRARSALSDQQILSSCVTTAQLRMCTDVTQLRGSVSVLEGGPAAAATAWVYKPLFSGCLRCSGAFLVNRKHPAGPEGEKILYFALVRGEQVQVKHNFESSGCLLVEFGCEAFGGYRLVRLPVQTYSVHC